MKEIHEYLKNPQKSIFQIVTSCGYGKSTTIPVDIVRNNNLKLVVVEPRVIVARSNAEYVNNCLGVRSISIVRGDDLSAFICQPSQSIIYCTTGKMRQMLDILATDVHLGKNICVCFSDWHCRDGAIAVLISKAMDLRKRGIEFSVYFTSAFHLCERWTDAIGFGAVPSVEFPQLTSNYKILHLPNNLSQMACKWTERIVSLITELIAKRSRGNWCILVTALGEQ